MAEETETHLEEVLEALVDTTDRARVPTAAAVPPAWDRGVEALEGEVGVAEVAGADEQCYWRREDSWGALK